MYNWYVNKSEEGGLKRTVCGIHRRCGQGEGELQLVICYNTKDRPQRIGSRETESTSNIHALSETSIILIPET